MSNYGWVITRDRLYEKWPEDGSSSVGAMGPSDVKFTKEEITKKGKKFSMYCDDKDCWYEGYILGGDGFEPIDDYGKAMASCVHIKIDGEWI